MPPVYFIIFMIIILIDIDVSEAFFFHSNIYNIFPRMDKACVANEDTK